VFMCPKKERLFCARHTPRNDVTPSSPLSNNRRLSSLSHRLDSMDESIYNSYGSSIDSLENAACLLKSPTDQVRSKAPEFKQEILATPADMSPPIPEITIPVLSKKIINELHRLWPHDGTYIESCIAYWRLKRSDKKRPLLQITQPLPKESSKGIENDKYSQYLVLKVQRCRLAKVQEILERIKQRERTKFTILRLDCEIKDLQARPLLWQLHYLHETLVAFDDRFIFAKPVDTVLVADYLDIIDNPMDFSTIHGKIPQYRNINEYWSDFYLMCNNAIKYNNRFTVYARYARELLKEGDKLRELLSR